MSRRIRSIKPELLEDERTATLSLGAWRLFVSCLLLADDHGNLRGGVPYLTAQVFWGLPASAVSPVLVAEWRAELLATGLLSTYEVRGQSYLAVSGWAKHQRIDNAGKRQVPGPDGSEAAPSTPRPSSPVSSIQGQLDLSSTPIETKKPASFASLDGSPRLAATRRESRLEGDREREEEKEEKNPPNPPPGSGGMGLDDEPWVTDEELADTAGLAVPEAPVTPRCPVSILAPSEPASVVTVLPGSNVLATPTDRQTPAMPPRRPVAASAPVPVASPPSPVAPIASGPRSDVPVVTPRSGARRRPRTRFEAPEADVLAVLEHWAATLYAHRKPVFDDKRKRRVADRLEHFTVAQLCQAIDGAKKDDWLMGRHKDAPQGGYRDVAQVLRDSAQVERLMDLAAPPRRPSAPIPPPPPPAAPMTPEQAAKVEAQRAQILAAVAQIIERSGSRGESRQDTLARRAAEQKARMAQMGVVA